MPKPLQFKPINVSSIIQDTLPKNVGYTTGHLISDLISMFEKKSAEGRLHQIVESWQKNALSNNSNPLTAKHMAVDYFKFFRRFPRTQLFHDILKYCGNDPISATEVFLSILARQIEMQGRNTAGAISALSTLANVNRGGINIPFLPPQQGSTKAGIGHPGLIAKMFHISELLKKLKIEYIFASKMSYEKKEVFYPDEEIEYSPMRSFSEINKITPPQYSLPDEIFYTKLIKKELLVTRYYERVHKPKTFSMLIDVSGSMEEKLKSGYSKAEYAIASAIALLQNALKGANKVIIRFFDENPYEPIVGTPKEIIQKLLECPFSGGGTSIDNALKEADKDNADEIILITDGEDDVTFTPKSPLTVYRCGSQSNPPLRKIARVYKVIQ